MATALTADNPFPIFTDVDGDPLSDGYIYVGTANLNPETNPITIYWDAALTIPAAQPVRTLNGYPSRNGSPARIYTASNYSIAVRNKNSSLVFSSLSSTDLLSSELVMFIQPAVSAILRTVQSKLEEHVSILDFIPVSEHAAIKAHTSTFNCTAAFAAAFASMPVNGSSIGGGMLWVPEGTYNISSLTWPQSVSAQGDGHYTSIIKSNTAATDALVLFQDVSRISMRDIQFDGNNNCSKVFKLRAPGTAGSMLFEHLDLHGALAYTVELFDEGTGAPDDIAHIVFNHCYLRSDPVVALQAQYRNAAANGFHVTFINGILSSRNNPSIYNAEIREGQTTWIDTFWAGANNADINSFLNGQVKVIGGRTESAGVPFLKTAATEAGHTASLPHIIEGVESASVAGDFMTIQGTRPVWTNACRSSRQIYVDVGATVDCGVFKGGGVITKAGSPNGTAAVFGQQSGTFLPTIVDAAGTGTFTYTKQRGYYTRQGRNVHCVVELTIASNSGGAGELFIANLPFTAAGVSGDIYGGAHTLYASNFSTFAPEAGYVRGGSTRCVLTYKSSNTAYTELNIGYAQAASTMFVHIDYICVDPIL